MGAYEWLKAVLEFSDTAFARHKIVLDEDGNPKDYVFLEVNPAFEKMTGLKREEILNKRVLTVIPEIRQDKFDWFSFYGQVALEGNTKSSFEKYFHPLKKWYRIEVISTERLYFTTIFHDIGHEKELAALKQKSQDKYLKIFKNSNDAIFIHDSKGQILDINPKACQLTAYSRDELLKLNIYQLVSDRGAMRGKKARSELVTREEVVLESQIIDKTGKLIDVSISASYFDKDNGIIMGFLRDISEIKKKELDLNNIIEGTRVGTWQWNIQDNIQIVNDYWAQMLGYTVEELFPLTTSKWQSLMHPEDLKKLDGFLDQHFENVLEQFECECRFKHKTGNWVWVLSRGRVLEWTVDGKPSVMFGTHLDITRLKETEKELIRLSEFQKLLMNMASKYINLSFSEIDQAKHSSLKEIGEFVNANRAYIFTYDWEKRIAVNTYEWCQEGIDSQIENLQSIPFDAMPKCINFHKEGKIAFIEDVLALDKTDADRKTFEPQGIKSLVAIPIMRGKYCEGFVGFDSVKEKKVYAEQEKALLMFFSQILLNIDTRAKLEKKIIAEKDKALEASRAKSAFLANMSHEIRTPLNGVIGFASIMLDTELDEKQKEYADTIMTSARSLLEIINDILDLSKIEAGKMELNPEKTDLFKLMMNTTTIVNLKAEERKNKLFYTIDEDVPRFIFVDAIRLKQILINLLSNATKFTKNGEIELKSKICAKDTQKKTCVLEFSVRDTGIGIKEMNQRRILEPFSQEDYTITKKYGGTGLGLAIIKSLLLNMNSSLKIDSAYGKGSRFSFTLHVPYEEEKVESTQRNKKTHKTIKERKAHSKVLIVEDHDVNMKVTKHIVTAIDKNAKIMIAKTGQEALDIFQMLKPDIILLDLRLPDIDGYEVVKQIRRSNQTVPIIALTALVVRDEKERCLALGMNYYLSKPLDLGELKEILNRYL